MAFDSELLRTHVAWRGQTLNLWGTPYHERKDRFYCDFEGETLFTMPPVFPWAVEVEPQTLRTELPVAARFLGVNTADGVTRLRYEVPQKTGSRWSSRKRRALAERGSLRASSASRRTVRACGGSRRCCRRGGRSSRTRSWSVW
ncbi:MAG: hypothetical protein HC841_02550 [Verrucomicrobiae bacterium]|nr:hypothetical protein [Verrucomicrobiae bacterium]